MQRRKLGRTGLDVSLLTFGCGAVGGLMTKGDPADQDRAVAWARDNGINHFDTAALYGNGASETNLGRALGKARDDVVVSTKVRLSDADRADPGPAIRASLETSLRRLQQDHVDLFQFHNTLTSATAGQASDDVAFTVDEVLETVLPVFEALRDEGKIRFIGFTANGDTPSLHRLVATGRVDSGQVFFNVLIPSAGEALPEGYPGQDYGRLLDLMAAQGTGSIGVRVLAGGAMSGSEARHPLGMPVVDPIGSGRDYAEDAARARDLMPVVEAGHAASLPELAVRFVIANPNLSTTEIGIANLDELQQAAQAVNKGPLSAEALAQIAAIRAGWCG